MQLGDTSCQAGYEAEMKWMQWMMEGRKWTDGLDEHGRDELRRSYSTEKYIPAIELCASTTRLMVISITSVSISVVSCTLDFPIFTHLAFATDFPCSSDPSMGNREPWCHHLHELELKLSPLFSPFPLPLLISLSSLFPSQSIHYHSYLLLQVTVSHHDLRTPRTQALRRCSHR